MTCIKTGANVYLASYGGVLHGDMFKLQGIYIFNHVGMKNMVHTDPGCTPIVDYTFLPLDGYKFDCVLYLDCANIIAIHECWVEEHGHD